MAKSGKTQTGAEESEAVPFWSALDDACGLRRRSRRPSEPAWRPREGVLVMVGGLEAVEWLLTLAFDWSTGLLQSKSSDYAIYLLELVWYISDTERCEAFFSSLALLTSS